MMSMGMIFSFFAIFVKESELSKVWLAGPTTIAVGLVLCGKVVIDCRPVIDDSSDDGDINEALGDEDSLIVDGRDAAKDVHSVRIQ